jgi:hypothetical protein
MSFSFSPIEFTSEDQWTVSSTAAARQIRGNAFQRIGAEFRTLERQHCTPIFDFGNMVGWDFIGAGPNVLRRPVVAGSSV